MERETTKNGRGADTGRTAQKRNYQRELDKVIEGLEPEVRDHEPRLALDGSPDGLKFYRILASEGKRFLRPGGAVYFEIGWDQAQAVSALLEQEGFARIRTVKDMAGMDRVVGAVLGAATDNER